VSAFTCSSTEDEPQCRSGTTADCALKTLGIIWNTQDDEICYSINPIKCFERVTKRNNLSEIAKIFDSIGLLDLVILYAKTRGGVEFTGTNLFHKLYTMNGRNYASMRINGLNILLPQIIDNQLFRYTDS